MRIVLLFLVAAATAWAGAAGAGLPTNGTNGQALRLQGGVPTWTGSAWYYRIEDYTTAAQRSGLADATAAVQSALDAIETAMKANGGGRYVLDLGDAVLRIDGGLNTRNGCNSQLVLPALDLTANAQCTLTIRGSAPPSGQFSVIGTIPVPSGGARIVSTLAAGSGSQPSIVSGHAPSGSGWPFTMVQLVLENIEFRTVDNPQITAVDLSYVGGAELQNIVVNTGTYTVADATFPTTTTSVGVIGPGINNDTVNIFHNVQVLGFYTGLKLNEHLDGDVTAFGCAVGVDVGHTFHGMHLTRLLTVDCPIGIKAEGDVSRLKIDSWMIEHAASGAWVTTADLSDAGNLIYGTAQFAVVLANVGVDHTFTKTGGGHFRTVDMGYDDVFSYSSNSSSPTGLTVKNSGTTGRASISMTNDLGIGGVFGTYGSAYTTASLQSQFAIGGDKGVFIMADGNTDVGGTDDVHFKAGGYNSSDSFVIKHGSPGSIQVPGLGSGTVVSDASGNLSVSSDARLKIIGAPFTRGLADVVKMTPRMYRWRPSSGMDTHGDYAGLIAQDVQAAIPEAVSVDSKDMLTLSDRPLISALINADKDINRRLVWLERERLVYVAVIVVLVLVIAKRFSK